MTDLTVWKFTVPVNVLSAMATNLVRIPKGARLLHAREQGKDFAMWFEVDPDAPTEPHHYQLFGTGTGCPTRGVYVGTGVYAEGSLVIHVYEVTE